MDHPSPVMSTEIVVLPTTGEIIDHEDPRAVADAIAELERVERDIKVAKGHLRDLLIAESARALTKTLRWGKRTAVIKGGRETIYDADAIERELLEAGFPPDRVEEIVVETVAVSKRVNAAEAKRAAGASDVAREIIERHATVVDKTPTVTVT